MDVAQLSGVSQKWYDPTFSGMRCCEGDHDLPGSHSHHQRTSKPTGDSEDKWSIKWEKTWKFMSCRGLGWLDWLGELK